MQKTNQTGQTHATDNNEQYHLPRTPDEYENYLAEKFYRIVNSPQFAVYDGFLADYYRIPKESDEFPGWVLPMRNGVVATVDKVVTVDDRGNIVDDEIDSSASSAAGVPSRSEGAAALAMPQTPPPATPCPPITNRGAK